MATKSRTPTEVLLLVGAISFRPFSQHDWSAWAGCESEAPMIGSYCEDAESETVVIIDGDQIVVMDVLSNESGVTDEGRMYRLVEGAGF